MKAAARSAEAEDERRLDRFGNPIDRTVGYARGAIITGDEAEAARQRRAYLLLRERHARLGDAGIYNLTGLIRGFPFAEGDEEAIRSYVHFLPRSRDELETAAIPRMGGGAEHDGFLAARVTSGMLAIMLTLVRPGDRVLSLVPADRSHPSIVRSVDLARGRFREVIGQQAFATALAEFSPSIVVITTICPSKHHLPLAETRQSIEAARRAGATVILDDAHMAARVSLYDEPGGLALGADIAVWSMDKHVIGPRAGFVAGRKELIGPIRAKALALGLEAQLGQYVAATRAVEAFDPEPIREAGRMAERLLEALQPEMDGRGYMAGAGIALSGEDLVEIALRRRNAVRTPLVPIEVIAHSAMAILEEHGAVTIPSVGMPGAACTFRLMMYPDGARMGLDGLVQCWRTAIDSVVAGLSEPELVRARLLG